MNLAFKYSYQNLHRLYKNMHNWYIVKADTSYYLWKTVLKYKLNADGFLSIKLHLEF